MFDQQTLLIASAVFVMATLYSTVGHGGGSGYLAVLAIAGFAPEEMRPTALLLNVVVASIATWKFCKTGTFRRDLFVPLICASIPAAFVGGYTEIPGIVYKPAVGVLLFFAAIRLFVPIHGIEKTNKPRLSLMIAVGTLIGVLSGVIGVGGGIFLSPVVLLLGWSTAKQTATMTAPFILVNSISGIAGITADQSGLPVGVDLVVPLAVAAVVGGIAGASFGSRRLGSQGLRGVLGIVLVIASIKMFLTMSTIQNAKLPDEVKSTQ